MTIQTKPINEIERKTGVSDQDSILILDASTGEARLASKEELRGEQGIQGIQGKQGQKGDMGERGPQGEPLTFDQLTSEQKAELRGEKGDRGPQGERGLRGEKGEKGEIGPQGMIGPQGERGIIGPQGEQGPKGDRGEKGNQGERGPQGIPGPQGPAGSGTGDMLKSENLAGLSDVGQARVNLDVYSKSDVNTAISNAAKEKVDKTPGKQLSTNDYTTEEKEKLANINTENIVSNEKLTEELAKKENALPSGGTSSRFLRGDKKWVDFAHAVRSTILTGLDTTQAVLITAKDSVLGALGKLQGQISAILTKLNSKADLVNGKVPSSQLPEVQAIDESNLVHKSGDEEISGHKIFNSTNPISFKVKPGDYSAVRFKENNNEIGSIQAFSPTRFQDFRKGSLELTGQGNNKITIRPGDKDCMTFTSQGEVEWKGQNRTGEWGKYTPTVTAANGSPISSEQYGIYKQMGRVVRCRARARINRNNSSGRFYISLPVLGKDSGESLDGSSIVGTVGTSFARNYGYACCVGNAAQILAGVGIAGNIADVGNDIFIRVNLIYESA